MTRAAGLSAETRRTASAPLPAELTAKPSSSRLRLTSARSSWSSSTSRISGAAIGQVSLLAQDRSESQTPYPAGGEGRREQRGEDRPAGPSAEESPRGRERVR